MKEIKNYDAPKISFITKMFNFSFSSIASITAWLHNCETQCKQRITTNLERNLFAADYRVVVRDADGAVLEEQTMSVEPCGQDVVKENNMVLDGEFDHLMSRNTGKLLPRNQGLTSEWDIGQSEYEFHFDGYMRDGLLIRDFQSATVTPAGGLVDGDMYLISLLAKVGFKKKSGYFERSESDRRIL